MPLQVSLRLQEGKASVFPKKKNIAHPLCNNAAGKNSVHTSRTQACEREETLSLIDHTNKKDHDCVDPRISTKNLKPYCAVKTQPQKEKKKKSTMGSREGRFPNPDPEIDF